jgi:tetratricopeptide (TPR) repeat protein
MLFSQFDECLKDFRKCRDLQGNNDPTCSFHIAHIEFRIRMSQSPMDPRPLAQLEEQISPLGSSEAYVLLGQVRHKNTGLQINLSQKVRPIPAVAVLKPSLNLMGKKFKINILEDGTDSMLTFILSWQLYMEMREFEKADTYYKRALADNEDDSHNAVVFTQQA